MLRSACLAALIVSAPRFGVVRSRRKTSPPAQKQDDKNKPAGQKTDAAILHQSEITVNVRLPITVHRR